MAIKRKVEEKTNIAVSIEGADDDLWIRVGSYSIVQSAYFIMNQMKREMKVEQFSCRAQEADQFVNIDLVWQGDPIRSELLRKWETEPLIVEGEVIPLTLREVVKRHNGELWSQRVKDLHMSYFRFLLPGLKTSKKKKPASPRHITAGSRPEFYDFDLFKQPVRKSEMDDLPLSQLVYTVFDTETTGLNPRGGDEIISFGALRILNGRLLKDEVFDQLVDPQRTVPQESVAIHGIEPEMLEGQPTIEEVLPRFKQFTDNTVLVAHNAAFDMLLLKLKEKTTGVKFLNPVLDTLLLSAVVHPSQEMHSLEKIAERLGVPVVARHTALGDALLTADVFLKLVPLLNKMGVQTLKEAHLASQKTYYARLKY
jgi:DNA polymerase-3 subunit epsilon